MHEQYNSINNPLNTIRYDVRLEGEGGGGMSTVLVLSEEIVRVKGRRVGGYYGGPYQTLSTKGQYSLPSLIMM